MSVSGTGSSGPVRLDAGAVASDTAAVPGVASDTAATVTRGSSPTAIRPVSGAFTAVGSTASSGARTSTSATTTATAASSAAASSEPLSSLLLRNDQATLERVMDDVVLGRAPESRLVELSGLLAVAQRGNTPAKRLLGVLQGRMGIDLGRVIEAMTERPGFRRLVEAGTLKASDIEAFARDGASVDALRRALVRESFRSSIGESRPGGIDRLLSATSGDRAGFARLLTASLAEDKDMRRWVEGDQGRRDRAEALALRAQPLDPSIAENRAVNAKVDAFRDWDRFPYAMIVVPGHTQDDARPAPGVDPEGKERLVQAKRDLDSGKAPFVLLSGGNVHPEGTTFYEALEMKKELVRMGVPADRIIVDAVARKTTTNLRNAGRYMIEHGLGERRALVTTTPLQDFYLSNPWISTFNGRCRKELGYKVGELMDAPNGEPWHDRYHTSFKPSREVMRIDWKEPLDP